MEQPLVQTVNNLLDVKAVDVHLLFGRLNKHIIYLLEAFCHDTSAAEWETLRTLSQRTNRYQIMLSIRTGFNYPESVVLESRTTYSG